MSDCIILKIDRLIEYIDDYSNEDCDPQNEVSQIANFAIIANIIDDLWVNIFCLCNVKSFISISHTCKHFHNLTNIYNSNNKNYVSRLKQYWKNQCQVLCINYNHEYKDASINDYNWYTMYQELVTIISNLFASQYLFKIEKKVADDKRARKKYALSSYLHGNKRQIQSKDYLNHIISAPHVSGVYKNKGESTNIDYNNLYEQKIDMRELVSDNDIRVLPTRLQDIEIGSFTNRLIMPIVQIIEHDCLSMFKLYTNETFCFIKNGYSNSTITEMIDPNVAMEFGMEKENGNLTLFESACLKGSVKIVNYLLEMMAPIGMKYCNRQHPPSFYTPLMRAVDSMHVKVVEILVPLIKKLGEHAINFINFYHQTALHIILSKRGTGELSQGNVDKIAKCLIVDGGIDVNVTGRSISTPLFLACSNGHVNVAKMLIQHSDIENNIDRCCMREKLALFALINRVLNKPDDVPMMVFKQFFQFIIDYGIKTQNDQLKDISKIRDQSGRTSLMTVAQSDLVKRYKKYFMYYPCTKNSIKMIPRLLGCKKVTFFVVLIFDVCDLVLINSVGILLKRIG